MLFSLMHIIHIVAVIIWIGGLAFVTMIIFPIILKTQDPLQKVLLFQKVEHRFARMARVYNLLVGISGFTMLFMMGWHRALLTRAGLPLLFMLLVWVFWAVMLFGLEPLVVRKTIENMAKEKERLDIDGIFRRMNRLHWILLTLSLAVVMAGSIFAH